MPRGWAWTNEGGSNLDKLVDAQASELERVDAKALDTLRQILPDTTLELLAEYETLTASNSTCGTPPTTIEERRAAVLAKLISQGGASHKYFKDVAKALGFAIKIRDKFKPFKAGQSRAGDRAMDEGWTFIWNVIGPDTTTRYFRAGKGAAGERLAEFGSDLLECTISNIAPAHTKILYSYFTTEHQGAANLNCTATVSGALKVKKFPSVDMECTATCDQRDLWKPSELDDLTLWLDATDEDTLTKTGDFVDEWADKSGLGNDATGTGGSRPEHGVATIGGQDCVSFNSAFLSVYDDPSIDLQQELDVFILRENTGGNDVPETLLSKTKYKMRQRSNKLTVTALGDGKEWTTTATPAGTGVVNPLGVRSLCYAATLANQTVPIYYAGDIDNVWQYYNFRWSKVATGLGLSLASDLMVYETFLYVLSENTNEIWKYDGSTWYKSADNGDVGTGLQKFAIYGGHLYVCCASSNNIYKITSRNGTSKDTWALVDSVGTFPIDMAVHDSKLWIACKNSNNIYEYNGTAFTTHASIDAPYALAVHGTGLFALGNGGTNATKKLYRWSGSGTSWSSINIPFTQTTAGVWDMASFDSKLFISSTKNASEDKDTIIVYNNDGSDLDVNDFSEYIDIDTKIQSFADIITLENLNGELWAGALNSCSDPIISLTESISVSIDIWGSTLTEILELQITEGNIVANLNALGSAPFYASRIHANAHNKDHQIVEEFDVETSAQLDFTADEVTINPTASLPASTELAVMVDDTAIQDVYGNVYAGIKNNRDWTFKTGT